MHVVCGWIGNSPRVAAKHYLQVTEDHYGKAVQNPVQTAHDGGRQEPSGETARSSGETLVTSIWCEGDQLLLEVSTKERSSPVLTNAAITVRS